MDVPPPDEARPSAVDPGEAVARLWFERDGEPLLHDEPIMVVEGVTDEVLERGPGRYPDGAAPGAAGNLGIAGHRTTWGAPFRQIDHLRGGDTIHVEDHAGDVHVYVFRKRQIVEPTDVWVVTDDDPIGLGAPTLTLTTCHPLRSNAERMIVFAELIDHAEAI